jgi:CPA2 family monovalent cation:H+ antiporter-2
VLAWIAVLTIGKAAILLMVAAILRWPHETGLRVALILAHGGEFGLLLLIQAMAVRLISPEIGQPVLLALIITMGLAPMMIKNAAWLLRRVPPSLRFPPDSVVAAEMPKLSNHVLICGCGRVGRLVALALEKAHLPYLGIEADGQRYREMRELGSPVLFGNASRAALLDAAELKHARLLVVTFDRQPEVGKLLHHVRTRNPSLPTLLSVSGLREAQELAPTGATAIFPESLAAGLAAADQTLLLAGLTQDQAAQIIRKVCAELSPQLDKVLGL